MVWGLSGYDRNDFLPSINDDWFISPFLHTGQSIRGSLSGSTLHNDLNVRRNLCLPGTLFREAEEKDVIEYFNPTKSKTTLVLRVRALDVFVIEVVVVDVVISYELLLFVYSYVVITVITKMLLLRQEIVGRLSFFT